MFEASNYCPPINDATINAFKWIKEVAVSGFCFKCKKKIPMILNKEAELIGEFISFERSFSEILGNNLPDIDAMLCKECNDERNRQ